MYAGYLQTYVERDVRDIKHILDLALFKRFLSLCAGRIGQVVNYASLANDCGIDEKTVKSWLGLLEACYIIFLVQPYFNNFGKRLTKSPKLYFIDTGLACSLLKISAPSQLINHAFRGPLVESCIMADLLKQQFNREKIPSIYFWRDYTGHKIDCLIEEKTVISIEIKASQTLSHSFFSQCAQMQTITSIPAHSSFIVYAGTERQTRTEGTALPWTAVGTLLSSMYDDENSSK